MCKYVTASRHAGRYDVWWNGRDVTNHCVAAFSILHLGFVVLYHEPGGRPYIDKDELSPSYGCLPTFTRWGHVHIVERDA